MARPRAILTVGIPGSGKTTYAQRQSFTGYQVICRDDIRTELFGDIREHGDEARVTKEADRILSECSSKGQSVVIADTNANAHFREQLVSRLSQLQFSPIQAHVFNVNAQTCIARNSNRPQPVPIDVIYRMEQAILDGPPLLGNVQFGLFDDVFIVNQTGASPLFPDAVGVGTDNAISIKDGRSFPPAEA